jgi:hypothetical protein
MSEASWNSRAGLFLLRKATWRKLQNWSHWARKISWNPKSYLSLLNALWNASYDERDSADGDARAQWLLLKTLKLDRCSSSCTLPRTGCPKNILTLIWVITWKRAVARQKTRRVKGKVGIMWVLLCCVAGHELVRLQLCDLQGSWKIDRLAFLTLN